MKDKNKDDGFFESVGRLLGYLEVMNISMLGVSLMILGIVAGVTVFDAEQFRLGAGHPMVGSGIVSAGAILAGAILQAGKGLRR